MKQLYSFWLAMWLLVAFKMFAQGEVEPLNEEQLGQALNTLFARESMWRQHVADPTEFGCAHLFPTKKACDPNGDFGVAGDSVLFNSLLCYSGEMDACKAVKKSQDTNGRFWRSPLHVGGQQTPNSGSFSKDHVLGLLLYFAVSKNRNAAQRWLWWIQQDANLVNRSLEIGKEVGEDVAREASNGAECVGQGLPCLVSEYQEDWEDLSYNEKIACGIITVAFPPAGLVCPSIVSNGKKLVKSGNVPRYLSLTLERVCEEAHCVLTPNLYALMYKTWKYIGLEPSTNMKIFRTADGEASLISQIEDVDPGVELHLKAVTALVRLVTHRGATSKMINAIVEKDGKNPFHLYLDHAPIEKILAAFKPILALTKEDLQANQGHQWSWERDSADEEWHDSMGWDLIFIKNIINPQLRGMADAYITNILPDKWQRLKSKLDVALNQLKAANDLVRVKRAKATDLVREVKDKIVQVELPAAELTSLAAKVNQAYQDICPLDVWVLKSEVEASELIVGEVFNDLYAESENYFNSASDPSGKESFWQPKIAAYAEDRKLLAKLADAGESEPCMDLLMAAKVIPLRIESDKTKEVNTALRMISDAILQTLRDSALAKEKVVLQGRVLAIASEFAKKLRTARLRYLFGAGQGLFADLPKLLSEQIDIVLASGQFVSAADKSQIKSFGQQILDGERAKWSTFTQTFAASDIVGEREKLLKAKAKAVREQTAAMAPAKRQAMARYWQILMQNSKLALVNGCDAVGAPLENNNCWGFVAASEAVEKDAQLDRFAEVMGWF